MTYKTYYVKYGTTRLPSVKANHQDKGRIVQTQPIPL